MVRLLYALFVSFQIISRIMRCFQFIKLETASLTNNNHDIVRIISACDYIFRKLIVHVAKFTDPEDCHSHEGYRLSDRFEAIVSRSTRCVFRYFFQQCLLFVSNELFLLSKSSIASRKPEMDFSHFMSYRNSG